MFNLTSSKSLRDQYGINHVNRAVRRCDIGLDDGSAVHQDLASYNLDHDRLSVQCLGARELDDIGGFLIAMSQTKETSDQGHRFDPSRFC